MKTVFSYAKPYKWPIAIALVLMLIELSVELIQPLLIAKIIDDGITAGNRETIILYGSIMMGLALLALVSGVTNSFFAAHAAQSFGFDLRQALFKQIQAFSMSTFLRFPTSSLITRLTSDVTMAQNILFMGLRILLRAPLVVIGSLVMAMLVNVKLASFLLIGIPFLFVFLFVMARKGVGYFSDVQRRLDRVNRVIQENLQAVRLIKAYLRGVYEGSRFSKVADSLRKDTVKAFRMMELIMPILLLIMNGSLMIVLWFGVDVVRAGDAQVGEIVAIVNYAFRITGGFSMFSFLIVAFSRAQASSVRMEEVLLAEDDREIIVPGFSENGAEKRGALEFNNVSFHYPGHPEHVLSSVSFTINPGEKIAVMGATGSGKSTMLNLIPRIFTATSGEILMDGKNIEEWPLEELRNTIGLVPQQSVLFTGTIRENLAWGDPEARADELEAAAEKAQIHASILRFPANYETRVGQKGVNLSGGQKQRLSIARALVRKPAILLLDDSTSALDVKTENALWEALEGERATMIVITQKIHTAQGADRILLLDEGKVAAYGTHEQLLNQSELYRKIAESQLDEEVADDGEQREEALRLRTDH
ncbi:ABC transporter ATP-binding protein [Sporosarcina gallistercoris]|uniref:ABC transporter ATP-binding protein n=1 Tax=Sporosarcina gallistercoris TaxID=2762245 RepID=A0ABR8PKI4_9BACL|nr:ABC transporter ATP-binding protein [Sporosarcina gallistercoris]MBD7908690.1 ABC transporter ATP-binding protein [Sporosarcina gallistercoris]